jgi:hypothetical protein
MARPKKPIPPDPDEFDGDPCEAIAGLLLLLDLNHGRDKFAREAICGEVERLFESTIYSQNRDTVAMEKHQRLTELYVLGNQGAPSKNGFPII